MAAGTLYALSGEAGRAADVARTIQDLVLPSGSLRMTDLGYLKLAVFAAISAAGRYWLSRARSAMVFRDVAGQTHKLAHFLAATVENQVDLPIQWGTKQRLSCRLVALRVPADVRTARWAELPETARRKHPPVSPEQTMLAGWTVYITNLSTDQATTDEVRVLARGRGQVELLFKTWTRVGELDNLRRAPPWRMLCETSGTVLAQIVAHWLLLRQCWDEPTHSLARLAAAVAGSGRLLLCAWRGRMRLVDAIVQIRDTLAVGGTTDTSRQFPRRHQLLADPPGRPNQDRVGHATSDVPTRAAVRRIGRINVLAA